MPGARALLGLACLSVLLAGCSGDGGGGGGEEHVPAGATITISGFSYSPATITVQQGDTVLVRNAHNQVHTLTLDSRERDTGDIPAGGEARFTMPTMGRHTYHCARHTTMTGTIVVQEP